jgi:hypothetical protein
LLLPLLLPLLPPPPPPLLLLPPPPPPPPLLPLPLLLETSGTRFINSKQTIDP